MQQSLINFALCQSIGNTQLANQMKSLTTVKLDSSSQLRIDQEELRKAISALSVGSQAIKCFVRQHQDSSRLNLEAIEQSYLPIRAVIKEMNLVRRSNILPAALASLVPKNSPSLINEMIHRVREQEKLIQPIRLQDTVSKPKRKRGGAGRFSKDV